MRSLRNWVPFLGTLALTALFLKMPEAPNLFGIFKCKTCAASPYLPLVGSAYFAVIIAISLLFPAFPTRTIARGGMIWSVLLAVALTRVDFPAWCVACLIGHACNIAIWAIWWAVPVSAETPSRLSPFRERLFLALFAPVCMVAMFGTLNLTFLVYSLKSKENSAATNLQAGDTAPVFAAQTLGQRPLSNADLAVSKGVVINFVSPNCPYCKEQLPILDGIAAQLANDPFRVVNVSPALPPELMQLSPTAEWVADADGKLRDAFQVAGYPTLFVLGNDGKIAQVTPGVPKDLTAQVLGVLVKNEN